MNYSPEVAQLYSQLGIAGTTAEAGLARAAEMMGSLQGLTCLDFGTGTGRTALFLKAFGAQQVLAVDPDQDMVNQAQTTAPESISFQATEGPIPAPDASFDLVFCSHLFVEIESMEEMAATCRELYRVLKPGGRLLAITANPEAFGANFVSYKYQVPQNGLQPGDTVTCMIKGDEGYFAVDDVYWPVNVMQGALQQTGFDVQITDAPRATGEGWGDEIQVAPDLIFGCVKR